MIKDTPAKKAWQKPEVTDLDVKNTASGSPGVPENTTTGASAS